jgi:hypothetical protein
VPAAPTIAGGPLRPPSLEHYAVLLAGLMLGVGTALHVIGQMLERVLKDAPDDGCVGGLSRFLGRV